MRPPAHYGKGQHNRTAMIPLTDVAKVWRAANVPLCGSSPVAYAVGHTLYEDMPHVVRARDVLPVSPTGDALRSRKCLFWLAKTALPMWVRPWVEETDPYAADTYLRLIRDIEDACAVVTVGCILQELYMLDFPKEVSTLNLHYAQTLGVRAFYQGALLGDTELHAPATTAVGLFLMAQQGTVANATLLLIEATQSTALTLFDELLRENQDA